MPSDPTLCVAVHDVRSLFNVGSIFRTASGAGVDQIYLSGFTGAPPDPRIEKVALGSEEEIPFERIADCDELLQTIENHYVVALEQHPRSVSYREVSLPQDRPVTVIVGGELLGLPDLLLERSDAIAEIPMAGEKESLNVASAFAVVAFEFAHQLGRLSSQQLRSRTPRTVRPGVLTRGQTSGELPSD